MSKIELSNEEKEILTVIGEALAYMDERDKGYILGMSEGMVIGKKEKIELVKANKGGEI